MLNIHQVTKLRRAVDPAPEFDGFDPVTGLPHRDLFYSRMGKQWDWSLKKRNPISLILFNLDHFQAYSRDRDESEVQLVLGRIGEVIADACRRRADLAGRTREGEFGVMLADCELAGAEKAAEHIRLRVDGLKIANPYSATRLLTVAAGGTCRTPTPARFQNSLVIDADRALKEAKESGHDRIRFCCH